MTRRWLLFAAAMLALLALAAALRLPRLEQRPMHADEANQAVKAGRLFAAGEYEYDTTDHHGPSLYWLTLPSLWASGAKDLAGTREFSYRIVPVIFGLGVIPLLLLFADGLGLLAVAAAALLAAISPALVYYSRYYIQETLLVFFTLAALACGWRYVRSGRLGWILVAGAAVGMMHATKETWILSAAAAVGAAAVTWGWSWRDNSSRPLAGEGLGVRGMSVHHRRSLLEFLMTAPPRLWRAIWRCLKSRPFIHLLAATFVAVVVAAAFFSMFGRNWHGPWDSIAAYANYFRRGSRQGDHSEPWHYYLQILFAFRPSKRVFWSEGLIAALALVGGIYALVRRPSLPGSPSPLLPFSLSSPSPHLLRFLTFYTVLLTVLYSVIGYKTPWCALSFLMGMILLAGTGTAAIVRLLPNWPTKLLAAALLAAGAGQLGWQAWQLSFNPRYMADPLNPYVYAHTPLPLPRLASQLDRLRQRVSKGRELWIQVVADNYWPLPWYLRKFDEKRVGYWLNASAWKEDRGHFPPPDVYMLSSDVDNADMADRLVGYGGPVYQSLRPGVLIAVYVRNDLWPAFLECQNEQ